ncbi:PE family protein [Mycobacterium tuberculosis]|uniref:PE family protein n=1 Tax=Mycobacterium tuberculosis TaxID=1773 RepID=A0A916PD11_MYCTX|nr:PE family protein [Mycobacterium tuberculosis]
MSLQTAAGFSAQGVEHAVVTAEGVEELGRAGVGVGESGASYLAGDRYLVGHGRGPARSGTWPRICHMWRG